MLGGIGFTVSLFIANLSYSGVPEIGAKPVEPGKTWRICRFVHFRVLEFARLKQVLPPAEVKR